MEIFIGRCNMYIVEHDLDSGDSLKCDEAWEAFEKAVRNRDPRDVLMEDFANMTSLLSYRAPKNQALFWSGLNISKSKVLDLVNHANVNGTTLEYTHGGSLLNELCFCGSTNDSSGWRRDRCPREGAMHNYWASASVAFAKGVEGRCRALLRPNPTVLERNATFEMYEIPNLDPDKIVESFEINVITNKEHPKEKCHSGTIKILEDRLAAKLPDDVKVECTDNPNQLLFLVCAMDPETEGCKALERGLHAGEVMGISIGAFLLGMIALVSLVLFLSKKRRSRLRRALLQFGDDEALFDETESYVPFEDQYTLRAR